jgi:hypothetical protein
MKRRKKSPDDDIVSVSFGGLGYYRPAVQIAQWKWTVFKELMVEIEEGLREMPQATKELFEWADGALERAESLKDRLSSDPDRLAAMYEVLEVSRTLDELHEELIELADDEVRERFAAKQAQYEAMNEQILAKALRVLQIARAQGLIVDEAPLEVRVVRPLTSEDIAQLN